MKYEPRKPISLAERREVEKAIVAEIEENYHSRTLTQCPDCGGKLVRESGCMTCLACAWNACSVR
jgi:ssDNA-binding Zn-finger/Zn-ribbon topoisomerase 1